MRYHNLLCKRLLFIYRHSLKLHDQYQLEKENKKQESAAEVLKLTRNTGIHVRDYYVAFLDQVKKLLDNVICPYQFEDNIRALFSTKAYHMFTIDKIVQAAVKALQQVSTDQYMLLDAHKQFRRELSGEIRSTPFMSQEIMNDKDAMESQKEHGALMWHEWPSVDIEDQEYEYLCQKYQERALDCCARDSGCYKIIVRQTDGGNLVMELTQLPVEMKEGSEEGELVNKEGEGQDNDEPNQQASDHEDNDIEAEDPTELDFEENDEPANVHLGHRQPRNSISVPENVDASSEDEQLQIEGEVAPEDFGEVMMEDEKVETPLALYQFEKRRCKVQVPEETALPRDDSPV